MMMGMRIILQACMDERKYLQTEEDQMRISLVWGHDINLLFCLVLSDVRKEHLFLSPRKRV